MVAYDSKYGNTKQVAEHIVEGFSGLQEVEYKVANIKEVDLHEIVDYDALIVGAPNHMGKPSRAALKFVDHLTEHALHAKWGIAFDTYFQKPKNFGKSMRKLEKQMGKKLPNLKIISPGLSVKVKGVDGPIAEDELPIAAEFGKRVGEELKRLQSTKG